MTNYITEKDHWQAVISIKQEGPLELFNYMLQLRCNFKVLFPSYRRLAEHFGVCVRTIGRWMTELKKLYLITDKKRWLKTSLYQINSIVLKFSEKYKQIFPALKHWTASALQSVYNSNVLHNYNDINNSVPFEGAVSQDSSSSQDFCKNPLPFSLEVMGGEYFKDDYAHYSSNSLPFRFKTPVPSYLEWAPSSMEENRAYKKFISEAEVIDLLADFVEPTTLDEIKSILTIPELIDWVQKL